MRGPPHADKRHSQSDAVGCHPQLQPQPQHQLNVDHYNADAATTPTLNDDVDAGITHDHIEITTTSSSSSKHEDAVDTTDHNSNDYDVINGYYNDEFELLKRLFQALDHATRESLRDPGSAHLLARSAFEGGKAAVTALRGHHYGSDELRWHALLDVAGYLKSCSQRWKRAAEVRDARAASAGASPSPSSTPPTSSTISSFISMRPFTLSSNPSSSISINSEIQSALPALHIVVHPRGGTPHAKQSGEIEPVAARVIPAAGLQSATATTSSSSSSRLHAAHFAAARIIPAADSQATSDDDGALCFRAFGRGGGPIHLEQASGKRPHDDVVPLTHTHFILT
ncbi:hypothetical protein N9L19_00010 [bacterium]|nr:hypothetical protein [bacterium]